MVGEVRHANITVTNNTTLKDVSDFLSDKGKDKTVLAKTNNLGQVVLYVRDKDLGVRHAFTSLKDGLKSKFFEGKEQLASKTISNLFKQYGETLKDNLHEKINTVDVPEEYRDDHSFKMSRDQLIKGRNAAITLDNTINMVGTSIANSKMDTTLFDSINSKIEVLTNFVTTSLESVIKVKGGPEELPPTTNKYLETQKTIKDKDNKEHVVYDLEIQGKIYSGKEILGVGGFGKVVRYANKDGAEIAVKLPVLTGELGTLELYTHLQDVAKELSVSKKMDRNNEHLARFTDHVELPNGMVALVGMPLENGNVDSLAKKLNGAYFGAPNLNIDDVSTPKGMIGDLERKLIALTLISDTAKGLSVMNDVDGVTHGDMKSLNVMIDDEGNAKIIDFGKTSETGKMRTGAFEFAGAQVYNAPEIENNDREKAIRSKHIKTATTEFIEVVSDALLDDLGVNRKKNSQVANQMKNLMSDLTKEIGSFVEIKNNSDLKAGNSFDTFGLGTMAYELFVGGSALNNDGKLTDWDMIDKRKKWSQTDSPFIGAGGYTNKGSGDIEIDGFLNAMLSSDEDKRLTSSQVRDHELMNLRGVGSDEVRDLIIAIASNDVEKITIARDKVVKLYS